MLQHFGQTLILNENLSYETLLHSWNFNFSIFIRAVTVTLEQTTTGI